MTTPVLRIVGGGQPTDEELAAVVTVAAMLQARSEQGERAPATSRWQQSARPGGGEHGGGWLAFARRSSLRGGR